MGRDGDSTRQCGEREDWIKLEAPRLPLSRRANQLDGRRGGGVVAERSVWR